MSFATRGDTMTTFIHTADWHLGMTRRYLSPDAQARYSEARIESVREIARLADSEGAEFVVACGDLFDSNHVDRQVVARAVDALGAFTVPVFILPGNHDPLDASSVYRSSAFTDRLPPTIHVVESADPVSIGAIELVGAPWHAKNPGHDPAARAIADLVAGPTRVLLAHGVVDVLSPDAHDASVISMAGLREALDGGLLAYVALGDRHSATEVGGDPRVRYPGTPVATDYGEVDPGQALVVRIHGAEVQVEAHRVGAWTFMRTGVRLESLDDVEALD
ncbi:MAG: metallophosphoesterase family protein, partial [Miltoncostaeaceae bacterium]